MWKPVSQSVRLWQLTVVIMDCGQVVKNNHKRIYTNKKKTKKFVSQLTRKQTFK